MSYEREAMPDANTPAPQLPIQMREERVIDPYAKPKLAKTQAPAPQSVQIDKGSESSAAVEPKPLPEESVTLSPQVAALARKEQKFRQQQQELKDQQLALEAERAEIAELKALKAKLAAKDYSGIESQVDYEAYTNYLIEKTGTTTPEALAIKKLEAKVEDFEKNQKETVAKQFEAAVNDRRKAVTQLVEEKPEYSMIKKSKQQETVVKHILDTWEHDGIELSPEEAAKEVEAELKARAKAWAALQQEEPAPEVQADVKNLPPLKQGIKTLSNNMTTVGDVKRPLKSFQGMNEAERYAEARRRAEESIKQKVR